MLGGVLKRGILSMFEMDLQLFAEKEVVEGSEGKEVEGANSEGKDLSEGKPEVKEKKEQGKTLSEDDVQRMIQSANDRLRAEYIKKVKALELEAENLKKEKMTAEEKAKYEEQQRRKELEDKDRELTVKELKLKSYEVMREKELPTDKPWQDMLLGGLSSEDEMVERANSIAKTLKAYRDEIRAEVYKEFGRNPDKREDGSTGGKKYTAAVLRSMTPDEINANWDEISKQLESGLVK